MKERLETLLGQAIDHLKSEGTLPNDLMVVAPLSPSRDPQHGDFASSVALSLAKATNLSSIALAEKIVAAIPQSTFIDRVEIAGPGFINFFLVEGSFHNIVSTILSAKEKFGQSKVGKGQRIHIEYVSANPTGPLHVGHGRGAAYGACVANLLEAIGYNVHREYYVNDAGRQMGILALSVWIRYLQKHGESIQLPKNAYQGDYIIDIALSLKKQYGDRFHHAEEKIQSLMPKGLNAKEDPETFIDAYIHAAKTILKSDFHVIFEAGLESILDDIKDDLKEFGVTYEQWFRESALAKNNLTHEGIKLLEANGYVYEKDGAKWFRATSLGDEKDRVLIRKNGISTYFASDVAYHLYKFQQGYDHIIDVFGADHHGFIARLRAVLEALGQNPKKLNVLLVQFAILYRGKERVSMSTRAGTFITLRELRHEVGNDAARFFYIMRKPEQHLDFDLELAKSKSSENPVYYIQYAHARICSIWRQLDSHSLAFDPTDGLKNLSLLISTHEKELFAALSQFPDLIQSAGLNHEPHLLAHYLQGLANQFHTYYNAERFLVDDAHQRNARLSLIAAIRQVLKNGLSLLGVSAPEEM